MANPWANPNPRTASKWHLLWVIPVAWIAYYVTGGGGTGHYDRCDAITGRSDHVEFCRQSAANYRLREEGKSVVAP
jgi:hypothetical protein